MAKSSPIVILNGPNLNMLGVRQPEIYGKESLADIEQTCRTHAQAIGFDLDFRQSNHEGQLVDWIQEARGKTAGLVINPGAYGHTSIALLDALLGYEAPIIEVHLSNIHRREAFRHQTYVSQAAKGVICGLGSHGYVLALDALRRLI
jgi:3-dehydroquinate dehydratase-2